MIAILYAALNIITKILSITAVFTKLFAEFEILMAEFTICIFIAAYVCAELITLMGWVFTYRDALQLIGVLFTTATETEVWIVTTERIAIVAVGRHLTGRFAIGVIDALPFTFRTESVATLPFSIFIGVTELFTEAIDAVCVFCGIADGWTETIVEIVLANLWAECLIGI